MEAKNLLALINGTIHTQDGVLHDHAVLIQDERIAALLPRQACPAEIPSYDLGGAHLSAGFIDLQLNGCGGVMFNQAPTVTTLEKMQEANLRSGTTSFLPTLITASDEEMRAAIATTRDYMQRHRHQVLGLHLEGPYTNPRRKGIHPQSLIRTPSPEMIDYLCDAAPWIAKITLAPETNQASHLRRLSQAGILVSIGHSAATYDEAMSGFDAGIRFATHLYNAMTPTLNGREPGVVGAIYDREDIYAGIIVDGHHVHPANVRLAHKMLGERLCLVTDATAPAGAAQGFDHFDFCGATVFYRDGQCIDANGTLGGSALTMIEGVRNLVELVGLPLDEALRMASLYPSRAIGMESELGSITPGKIANLVVFDDHYRVHATLVNGHYQEHKPL
ncbi:MAG: N-acetylglucosamine-6-phosphate deacetylase [Aeromonadaceae bacterium]